MSLIEWAILIGFGVPIVSLTALMVTFAVIMAKQEARHG